MNTDIKAHNRTLEYRKIYPSTTSQGTWWHSTINKYSCRACTCILKPHTLYFYISVDKKYCFSCAISDGLVAAKPVIPNKNISTETYETKSHPCTCDFDTVIMATGCICGGV